MSIYIWNENSIASDAALMAMGVECNSTPPTATNIKSALDVAKAEEEADEWMKESMSRVENIQSKKISTPDPETLPKTVLQGPKPQNDEPSISSKEAKRLRREAKLAGRK